MRSSGVSQGLSVIQLLRIGVVVGPGDLLLAAAPVVAPVHPDDEPVPGRPG